MAWAAGGKRGPRHSERGESSPRRLASEKHLSFVFNTPDFYFFSLVRFTVQGWVWVA